MFPSSCSGRAAPLAPLITMSWRQEKIRLGKNVETISKTSGKKMSNILFSWMVSLKFRENNCSWKISVFAVLFFLFYLFSHASYWMYFLLFISTLSFVTLYPIPYHRKVQRQQKRKNEYNKDKNHFKFPFPAPEKTGFINFQILITFSDQKSDEKYSKELWFNLYRVT